MHKSDEVKYSELNIYMHNSYVKGKDHWPQKISDALNVIVKYKGRKMTIAHQYGSSKGVALTTKGNTGGFNGDCYNCGKYRRMTQECPEPRK